MTERLFDTLAMPPGQRVACRVEYEGSSYCGWQAQPHLNVSTVQETLEQALSTVAGENLRVQCAGRTDTGVHGYSQIVHFDAPVSRSEKAWVMGGNANLPYSVRLHWAVSVPQAFHARHSALARRYRYVIIDHPVRPALMAGRATWQRLPLVTELMHEAAQELLGEQDFSAFRAAACQSKTAWRNVHSVSVRRHRQLVVIEIQANAFLHHMVRNIAGSLMVVGLRTRPPEWIAELLRGRDRKLAAATAPADGLYLVDVEYPPEFALPDTPPGPWWM